MNKNKSIHLFLAVAQTLATINVSASDDYYDGSLGAIEALMHPGVEAEMAIDKHRQTHPDLDISAGSDDLELGLGDHSEFRDRKSFTEAVQLNQSGLILHILTREQAQGVFGKPEEIGIEGTASQKVNVGAQVAVHPAAFNQTVQYALNEAAQSLPDSIDLAAIGEIPEELELPDALKIDLKSLSRVPVKNPVLTGSYLPLSMQMDVDTQLDVKLTNIKVEGEVRSENFRVLLGIPLNDSLRTYFYGGFEQKIDTAFMLLSGQAWCRAKVKGSLSVQSGGDVLAKNQLDQVFDCYEDGPTRDIVKAQRVRWNYTAALVGFGHVFGDPGNGGSVQILVEGPAFQRNNQASLSGGDEMIEEFRRFGNRPGFEASADGCMFKGRLCTGASMRMISVIGNWTGLKGKTYAALKMTSHSQFTAQAEQETTLTHTRRQGALSFDFNGEDHDYLFQLGLVQYRYSHPGFGDQDDNGSIRKSKSDDDLFMDGMGRVKQRSAVDIFKKFYAADETHVFTLGFLRFGVSQVNVFGYPVDLVAQVDQKGGIGGSVGGKVPATSGGTWKAYGRRVKFGSGGRGVEDTAAGVEVNLKSKR